MQLYQQWLQVAAATLHIEEREEQRRRRKEERRRMEARRRTRRQRTHSNLVDGESTDAVDRVWMPAEAVRSQYGLTLFALSAAYVKDEITFKIGLQIAADRGRNSQTQYGYSTHTVRIPRGSRRIEHPPRSAASVRRREWGLRGGAYSPASPWGSSFSILSSARASLVLSSRPRPPTPSTEHCI